MTSSAIERAAVVAKVAGDAATDVDGQARFPREAVDEMRRQRLLSLLVPERLGGDGAALADVAACARIIGGACASSGMTFAMHQIQVACLVGHGGTPALQAMTEEVASQQILLASATSEVNIGGDVRSSICALEVDGDRVRLAKQAPVISYGDEADAILVTARRTPESPSSDQVLAACRRADLILERTSTWDTLGFRGTASHGYRLEASLEPDMVLTDPFGDVSAQTMLPVSHILWASVWLGLAEAAARTAQQRVRSEARKKGTAGPAPTRLAELSLRTGQFRSQVTAALALYEQALVEPEGLSALGFAIAMNNLKITAAQAVVDVVSRALAICGIEGYRQDSRYSLGRHLRDSYGAGLMVNSDRILANNAQLLLGSRDL